MKTQTNPTQSAKNESSAGKVLTVYLNINQSVAANRNREFEALLESKLREAESLLKEAEEVEEFRQCAGSIRRFVSEYRPKSISVALFSPLDGRVTSRELNVSVETEVRWQTRPYVQPLLESMDEFEETLIVLLDGAHSRLLTSFLGRVTEHQAIANPFPTAHTKAPGHDRMKSQTTFHRKSDEREVKYLKTVIAAAEAIIGNRSIRRVVLAGNNVASKELYSLLPKDVRTRVTSFVVLPVDAPLARIAEVVAGAEFQAEREQETAKVASLLERSGGNRKAVVGVDAAMEALTQGSVHELIYAQGLSLSGGRCEACGAFSANRTACPQCQAVLKPVADAIDLAIDRALDIGATIEQVRGKAAEALLPAGGIGAFLRF
jgi:peptide subunit release factor 1 (eRF1)